jgi:hypothetical protein
MLMEKEDINQSTFDVSYDENVKQSIKSAAEAGKAAAVAALVSTALMVLTFLVTATRMYGPIPAVSILSVLIRVVVAGFLFYYLNKFATMARSGINGNDPATIGQGISGLGSYFKLAGTLLLIAVAAITLRALAGGLS